MPTEHSDRTSRQVEYIDERGQPVRPRVDDASFDGARRAGSPVITVRSFTVGTAPMPSGTGLLGSVWRTGVLTGLLITLLGLAMIALTSGIAAVVCWPIGTFTMVAGGSVVVATLGARRATYELAERTRTVTLGQERGQEPRLHRD